MSIEPPPLPPPAVRRAARVIVLDLHDRVLLIRAQHPFRAERDLWLPPGGGLQPRETYAVAARRELWEETGIDGVTLSDAVWRRAHTFEFQGRRLQALERYFVVRVEAPFVGAQRLEPGEERWVLEHRWWRLEEIAAAQAAEPRRAAFVPRRLAALLPALIAGEWPSRPVALSD